MAMSISRVSRLLTHAAQRVTPIASASPIRRHGGNSERRVIESAMGMVARGLEASRGANAAPGERHPLAPAAVRVERSRGRGRSGKSNQTAVTMWFGDGPNLPAAMSSGSPALRAAARIGAGALVAVAFAAATALASRADEPRIVDANLVDPRDTDDIDDTV